MNILAINPWIYDFAAYDFWLKPYGFLVILTYLKNKGINIEYIDCLKKETKDNFGRGKYYSEKIKKPEIFNSIPRYYKRYGITIEEFKQYLNNKNPDYILITSSMTYWYNAIIDTVNILKTTNKKPIILGGTYVNLLYEHAKENIPVDYIFTTKLLKDFFNLLNIDFDEKELYFTLPEYEYFYKEIDYVVFRTSWGCPFNCSFCAIKETFPYKTNLRLPIEKIINFILKYYKLGIKDFVLYDDAFLYEQDYAIEFLKEFLRLNIKVRFHTPNALHLRFLNQKIADLLKKTNFINPHFGLETLDQNLQKLWGDKVNRTDLIRAVNYLKDAGFKDGEFSVYLLFGYPNQDFEELKKDIEFLNSLGIKVSLAEYSPTPKTELFYEYQEILKEPLLHNNSIFIFWKNDIKKLWEIKNYTRQLNNKITSP